MSRRSYAPFLACAFSLGSSDDADNTRKCSSSKPISPRVSLLSSVPHSDLTIQETYPAKTPPASTNTALMIILYQNSAEPGCASGSSDETEALMYGRAREGRDLESKRNTEYFIEGM